LTANEQKHIARQAIRDYITSHIPAILEAQVGNALGINYMILRRPDGSFAEATDEAQIKAAIAQGAEAFKLYTRQPHQGSAAMLLAYAADKPVEPMEVTGAEGGPLVVSWKEPNSENP
jgi:rhamnogalacturonyl hydrolase YesR